MLTIVLIHLSLKSSNGCMKSLKQQPKFIDVTTPLVKKILKEKCLDVAQSIALVDASMQIITRSTNRKSAQDGMPIMKEISSVEKNGLRIIT